MKKINYLIPVILMIMSCTEEKSDDKKITDPVLKVMVYDATSWTPSSNADLAESASVKIFDEFNNYEQTTDSSGSAYFKGLMANNSYFVVVDKGDLSNLLEQVIINNEIFGLPTNGIFQNQSEIDDQPYHIEYDGDTIFAQPNAQVGDLRLSDVNADGVINENDKTRGFAFDYLPYVDVNGDMIINNSDKINGKFVLVDSVKIEIWIGK
jgi:hypothetical protein